MPTEIPKSSPIYVAGHRGLVGSAIFRRWFKANRPEYVFLVAGTVGGIWANATRPAEFIKDYHG